MPATNLGACTYVPLETESSIRLLTIHPDPAARIECSLQVVELSDETQQSYDCLSYTWGDPICRLLLQSAGKCTNDDGSPQILCDGKRLDVTENLLEPLKEMRRRGLYIPGACGSQRIWIDAICINQGDMVERSRQVAIMDRIYKGAAKVLVWLGPKDEHLKSAMSVMDRLAHLPNEKFSKQRFYDIDDLDDGLISQALDIKPMITTEDWFSYGEFLQRNWFGRVWIIQEGYFAQSIQVLCGEEELDWSIITKCARIISKTNIVKLIDDRRMALVQATSPNAIPNSGNIGKQFIFDILRSADTKQFSLDWLLSYSRYFGATNPRDHVFGVIGMHRSKSGSSGRHVNVDIDYELKTREVFTNATHEAMLEAKRLSTLRLVEHSETADLVPSWVPDYRQAPYLDSISIPPGNTNTWNASKSLRWKDPQLIRPDARLVLDGYRLDSIAKVGPSFAEVDQPKHQLKTLLEILLDYQKVEYPGGLDPAEAFWRTLVRDTYRDSRAGDEARRAFGTWIALNIWSLSPEGRAQYSFVEDADNTEFQNLLSETRSVIAKLAARPTEKRVIPSLDEIDAIIELGHEEGMSAEHAQMNDDSETMNDCITQGYGGRRFFCTKNGYFGISAQHLRDGDEVWILRGGEVPYVLNKTNHGFELVGEAYVHKVMYGEVEIKEFELESVQLV